MFVQMSRASWFFVGAGLLALVLAAMSGIGKLGSALVLLLLGAGSGVVSLQLRRRAQRCLPDVPEKEFLRKIRAGIAVPDELLLAERRHVARVLAVHPDKLDPHQSLDELSRRLDFVGSFSVAFNDLRYEVEELYEDSSLEPPEQAETVGDLITQLAQVKHRR